jgi:hypothetical protein
MKQELRIYEIGGFREFHFYPLDRHTNEGIEEVNL